MARCVMSSRYDKSKVLTEFDLAAVKGMRTHLEAYFADQLDERTLACKIIEALFERDFGGTSDRWDIDSADVAASAEPHTFELKKQATYDRKDIYAVASSKATIVFTKELITIHEYSHYCAG
jgi:hypothetical protein